MQIIVLTSIAQDSLTRRHEFGSILITRGFSSSNFNIPDNSRNQFFSGIFYRFTQNNLAYRAGLRYMESLTKTNNSNCKECYVGNANNKNFEIKVGAQYSLIKKSYLYILTDLYYKNLFATGNIYGGVLGLNHSFSSTTNAVGLNIGFGSKIKIFKQLYISPEIYYDYSYSATSMQKKSLVNFISDHSNYTVSNLDLKSRIALTVGF